MLIQKFKKGDRVRVLTWDEMLRLGATIYSGYASYPGYPGAPALDLNATHSNYLFLHEMRSVCGIEFIIPVDPRIDMQFPHEQRLASCSEILPSVQSNQPITNFMVKTAMSKYPSNHAKYAPHV